MGVSDRQTMVVPDLRRGLRLAQSRTDSVCAGGLDEWRRAVERQPSSRADEVWCQLSVVLPSVPTVNRVNRRTVGRLISRFESDPMRRHALLRLGGGALLRHSGLLGAEQDESRCRRWFSRIKRRVWKPMYQGRLTQQSQVRRVRPPHV